MHWAAHGHTAAEIIVERADSDKDFMDFIWISIFKEHQRFRNARY